MSPAPSPSRSSAVSSALAPRRSQREIEALVDQLTLSEQVSLLAGVDNWHTAGIPRVGIPAMRVTDGPAGARGTDFLTGPDSVNVPCGTALAASFDPALVERIGQLLGKEARAKGARVLLAPTVNLHRTPIGGRNFECQSEDPFLSAQITVGYVRGVQHEGVAACVKHYIGNDTEFERMTIDSQISERTLREVYLQPFEAAVTDAGAMAIMTSYNRTNGSFVADSKELVTEILRNEWGFEGIVMTDWFATHDTVASVEAGLDLEMPGPTRERGDKLLSAVQEGRVDAGVVRGAAHRMVSFLDRMGAFEDVEPGPETTRDEPADRVLVREAGAAGMVLLRNEGGALPLSPSDVKRVAVIGPNAARGRIMGGGSARVNPVHEEHPLPALQTWLAGDGVEVVSALGCTIDRSLPEPAAQLVSGATIEYFESLHAYESGDAPVLSEPASGFRYQWMEDVSPVLTRPSFVARITAAFTPDVSGTWSLSVTSVGRSRALVDGTVVADDVDAARGGSFFGIGRDQTVGEIELEAGRTYQLVIENIEAGAAFLRGMHLGCRPPISADLVADAADLAATTDLSIIVVGTSDDWESEGYDRTTIDLPGRQDELIAEVAKVSPRTIVVINAGSPVSMPWLDDVDAVLFVWFPGQEFGGALVDVLSGSVDPGGRLPVTMPRRLEDSPAFEHHPGRNGIARYIEGRLMGYRFYDTVGRDPRFPFGFGLSYGTTTLTDIELTVDRSTSAVTVSATVSNTSARTATEVVQVYAHDPEGTGASDDPYQRLVGFAKVSIEAAGTARVAIELDPRWAAHWDVDAHAWAVRSGTRTLRVGRSSRDVQATLELTV